MNVRYHNFASREQVLETVLALSRIGYWELVKQGDGQIIHMDGRTASIFGMPDEETTMDMHVLLESCHEHDRAVLRAGISKMLGQPGRETMIEYRVWSRQANQWRWMRSFGRSYSRDDGAGGYILGSTQDIQDSVALESFMDHAKEVNERTQIMLDATPLCCNFWDKDYNNIDCNQEAANLFDLPSKQAYLDNFDKLSPEYQPDGTLSSEKADEYIKEAFEKGKVVFEWMHQKLNGEQIPAEITLVRVKRGDEYIVVGYTRDLREYKRMTAAMREANERTQIMLDTTPLCSNFWDKDYNNIDCNQEAANLFDLPSKQAYLDNFNKLSPEYQPDGTLSSEKADRYIKEAFEKGKVVFEWMHQKLNGEKIPAEITLVRVKRGDEYIVVGYTRDLREYERMTAAMREANERTQIMLDATPLCCNLWDDQFNNIDCNEEAVKLFDLSSKKEYLDRFYELSPEYQPDGQLSSEKSQHYIARAFEEGKVVFEWMHQKLDGEQIPAEITLVRVKRGDSYIVAGYTRDMRDYKKMMAQTNEANERTQIMLDATPLCCNLWDDQFNNIDCNEEAVKLFELSSKKEYLDRFYELSPEYQPDGQLSSEKSKAYITQAFEQGKVVFEWMHQKLDGEQIPAEITLVRVKRGDTYIVTGYTRDMRDYKKMMAQTNEANERTQIMLDATPLCCNLWDENFNNVDCNEEAVKLFGLKNKQEYLDRFFELSPEYQPCGRLSSELAVENITRAFNEGSWVFEWMHQKLDGEQIPAEITLVRVKRGDTYIVAGYTRDMRDYKKMMKEIRQVEADLRLARDAAEDSARSKSEFLANMSHEIRTPMNAILGMLHLIQVDPQSMLTEKQSDYLNKTEQSAKTLLRIINDILDFSKIEAGKLEMENVHFTLNDVLKQMTDMFGQSIADKGLTFDIDASPTLPQNLIGDPLRLAQVLMNLLGNSIKFTEKGGIRLTAKEIARKDSKATIQFSVKDTGIGMDAQQVAGLFIPFTQADTSTTRKYGGTGLGLAISKKLVNMMHGDIWCVSEPGQGAEFFLTAEFDVMDAEKPDPVQPGDPIQQPQDSAMDMTGVKPILLAEDNEINQIIAKAILEMRGYQVDIANNGREAIDMLVAGDYELVLMDIQMPVMDGITATKEIRKLDRFKGIPIIAMTAHAMSGDYDKSIAAGMNDHVTKPIETDHLYETLRKWIERQREGQMGA